jgi:hypothetical protein
MTFAVRAPVTVLNTPFLITARSAPVLRSQREQAILIRGVERIAFLRVSLGPWAIDEPWLTLRRGPLR